MSEEQFDRDVTQRTDRLENCQGAVQQGCDTAH
jgi:hypothetical protein